MKKIEHLPINWVNGQKINNTHFFETYYNVVEMLRQNREEELTSYNYGFGDKSENKNVLLIWILRVSLQRLYQ